MLLTGLFWCPVDVPASSRGVCLCSEGATKGLSCVVACYACRVLPAWMRGHRLPSTAWGKLGKKQVSFPCCAILIISPDCVESRCCEYG